jgi:hypothetical protein
VKVENSNIKIKESDSGVMINDLLCQNLNIVKNKKVDLNSKLSQTIYKHKKKKTKMI